MSDDAREMYEPPERKKPRDHIEEMRRKLRADEAEERRDD